MNETTPPTKAGQLVRWLRDPGSLGITTDAPRKRTPSIPVMFVGAPYPVLVTVSELVLASVRVTL